MRHECERIADQLERAYDGDAWHGPPLTALLDGVDAAAAAAHPVPGAHSIWEIVLHIEAWAAEARRRLSGEGGELSDAQDWPAVVGGSEDDWRRTKESLQATHRELQAAIAELTDERLDRRVSETMEQTLYVLLHGVIQHHLYHGGQLALLRKMATT